MADKSKSGGPTPGPRRKRQGSSRQGSSPASFLSRNAIWFAVAVVLILAGVLLKLATGGDDATDDGAGGYTGGDFHSLVVDPADPDRIFVGGHTAVSVSTDGGATWQEVSELRDADAMGWGFTDNAIYVSGHPGLNRSTDDGATFERINDGLPNTDLHAFGAGGGVLYASTPGTGFMAADQDTGTWEARNTAVGSSFFGRILVDPDNPDRLIAADAAAGVAASDDAGRTWQLLDTGLESATWVSRGGDSTDVVVASGPAGAAISTDAGATWTRIGVPEGVSLVEAVPGAERLYAGAHDGSNVTLYASDDGGATWNPAA